MQRDLIIVNILQDIKSTKSEARPKIIVYFKGLPLYKVGIETISKYSFTTMKYQLVLLYQDIYNFIYYMYILYNHILPKGSK